LLVMMCHTGRDNSWKKLENIDEEGPSTVAREVRTALPPETPTEMMEFLGRSWSISAVELTRAFFNNSTADTNSFLLSTIVNTNKEDREDEEDSTSMASSRDLVSLLSSYFLNTICLVMKNSTRWQHALV